MPSELSDRVLVPVQKCPRCKEEGRAVLGKYVARAEGHDYFSCSHVTGSHDIAVTKEVARQLGYGGR